MKKTTTTISFITMSSIVSLFAESNAYTGDSYAFEGNKVHNVSNANIQL